MQTATLGNLRTALRSRMQAGAPDLSPAETAAFVDGTLLELTATVQKPDQKRRIDDDLLRSNVAYAIPYDALELFPSLVKAAIGAFASGPIGALTDVVGLLFRYQTMRVELTAEEAAVLRVLRSAKTARTPPLSSTDIEKRLAEAGLALKSPIDDVLAAVKGKKTDKVTLVIENDGRWTIGNV